MNKNQNTIKKIIPSPLEKKFQQFLYNIYGNHIPKKITPNQITLIGALGGLLGIVCVLLSKISPFFLVGTILGITCHLICDDLDGFVARTRKMSSYYGSYFDLLVDILHITLLIIALSFTGYINFKISIFLVPVYSLILFTAMNYILYFKEFLFPRIGPIETHLVFIVICIGSIFLNNNKVITFYKFSFTFADTLLIIGGILMYYEMIRLQIQLLRRLRLKDEKEKRK